MSNKCTLECQYNHNGNCHFHNSCIIKKEFDKHHPNATLTVLPPQTSYDAKKEKAKEVVEFAKNFNPFQHGNGCLLGDQHTR